MICKINILDNTIKTQFGNLWYCLTKRTVNPITCYGILPQILKFIETQCFKTNYFIPPKLINLNK